MKIATWNVNGIRAREAQLCEWLERDQPDVVCLQELKADPSQIPERCNLADYHVFWHGLKAYSGVSLHIKKSLLEEPAFSHPEFDMETRIVQTALGNLVLASVYVPNGGKDYPAKLGFLTRLAAWAKQLHDEGREVVLCGDINIARTEMDVHPRERKPVIGQRPEERDLSRRCSASTWSTSSARSTRTIRISSRGGRRGATCASATSAGASTTSSPRARSPRARRAVSSLPTSERATMRR